MGGLRSGSLSRVPTGVAAMHLSRFGRVTRHALWVAWRVRSSCWRGLLRARPLALEQRPLRSAVTRCERELAASAAEVWWYDVRPAHLHVSRGSRCPPTHPPTADRRVLHCRHCRYPFVPGIYTRDQIEGWRPVVGAVHGKCPLDSASQCVNLIQIQRV